MMKKYMVFIYFIITMLLLGQNNEFNKYQKTHFSVGAQLGMLNGVGGQIFINTSNFAEDFPFSVKLGIGISYSDAGDPLAARKIFINNNTNGIPEQSGSSWDFSLDFLYRNRLLGLKRNYLYAGPRYVQFTGNFNFIGGNEDFDVTSDQWGVGLGIENYFKILPVLDLVINLGYDYYIESTLYGHDTSYNPDGQDLNPREDYNFNDADKAINQPNHQIKLLIGMSYNLK